MVEKEIALINKQLESLVAKNFDLEAWKSHTIIFLERIFGKESSKVRMIKELNYNYSSWSLRDANWNTLAFRKRKKKTKKYGRCSKKK